MERVCKYDIMSMILFLISNKMDRKQLDLFLDIYPNIKNSTIQTFNDNKNDTSEEGKMLARMYKIEDNIRDTLDWLNKKWAWIFFSVNQMETWKRNKESVKKINSWICDIDSWTKKEQEEKIFNCPLTPSLVVESWHWYHLYYFCEWDVSVEDYHKYNWWLCNYFNWDTKIPDDEARVLRIPWFYHMKDPENPFLVSLAYWAWDKYTVEQMKKTFPDTMSDKEKKLIQKRMEDNEKQAIVECDDNWFWEHVCKLDAREMLEAVSWTSLVWYETISFKPISGWKYQILCNWKSTSCWIDSQWLIGSYSWGWPFWTRWIAWYRKIDWKEVYKVVEKVHPELIEKYKNKDKFKKKINQTQSINPGLDVRRTTNEIKRDFKLNETSWWLDYLDNTLMKFDNWWELVVLYWYPWCWKTEIWFFIARHNKVKTTYFCLEIPEETIIKRWALKACWYTQQQVDNWLLSANEQTKLQDRTNQFKRDFEWKIDMVSINQQPTVSQLIDYMDKNVRAWEIVIIDNLGKILWEWKDADNENARYSDITARLQTYAYTHKITIILQHHWSKPTWKKNPNDSESAMEDVPYLWPMWYRWSWKISDNATRLVEVHRNYRCNTTQLLQYKHTPTWITANALLEFDKWEFIEC